MMNMSYGNSSVRPVAGAPVRKCAMGEGVVAGEPHIILSSGLGSCVVVTIYDAKHKIGGLAHIMLPNRMRNEKKEEQKNPHSEVSIPKSAFLSPQYMCADTAIATLLEELRSLGAVHLVAKIVGGAQMYSSYEDSNHGIGKQNISSIKHILKRERIPIIGEDVGGHHGRNVEFYLDSGKVIVRAIGKGDKRI